MASLIGWLKDREHQLGNIFHNDVVAPIHRDIVSPVNRAIHQAPNIVRPIVNRAEGLGHGLYNADKYIASNLGLPQLGNLINPTTNFHTKVSSGEDLLKGIVGFPLQAGNQLGNTINRAIGAPEVGINAGPIHVQAPSLQTQYRQTKQKHGTLPAIAETAFSGATDISPLLGAAKITPKIPLDEAGFAKLPKKPIKPSSDVSNLSELGIKTSKQPYTGPNLNKGAFSKADRANLEKQIAKEQRIPKQSNVPIKNKVKVKGKTVEVFPQNPIKPIKLPEVKSATEAIRASESLSTNFEQRARLLADQQDRVLGKSLKNRDAFYQAIEHPETAKKLSKSFKNPQDFLNLLKQHKNVTDLEHASQLGASNPRPYFGGESGYVHHNVDLSTPEKQAIYDKLLTRTTRGGTSQSRLYPTIDELKNAGLSLQNIPAGKATRQWATRQARIMRDAALADRLTSIDPNLSIVNIPGEGTRFTSANPEFNKQLKGVQPYQTPTVMKIPNALNTATKQIGLFGGGFHDLKTAIRISSQELFSKRNPIYPLIQGTKEFASKKSYDNWVQGKINDGWGRIFSDADVAKTNIGADLHGAINQVVKGDIERFNPYMKRLFQQKLDYYKKYTVIRELESKGITPKNYDTLNPAQRKIVEDVGRQAQNWYGGLNQRTLAKSPIFQQVLKYITLAPDFTEGKIRSVGNVVKGDAAGSLARRQVIGEAVGLFILSEAANKAISGKFYSPATAFTDPQARGLLKDTQGRPLAIRFPGSEVSDVYRGFTDPGHFLQSHMGALGSVGQTVITGKDYFGNPIIDPFKNPNPSLGQRTVAALKTKATIPGVQVSKTLSNKQDWVTAAINTFGFRVNLDKSDPKYQETQSYFKKRDNFTKGLNPNELALFSKFNPTKKDREGNVVSASTPLTKPSDYADMISNPKFTKKYQNYQKSQAQHDPLWDLPPDQLRAYMEAQVISKYNPGGDSTTTSALYKRIPESFYKKRTQYFNNLIKKGVQLPKGPAPKPSMPQDLVNFSNSYHKLPYGTGARSAALRSIEGQKYIAYLDKNRLYNNQERADLGLPPLSNSNTYSYSSSKSGHRSYSRRSYARGGRKSSSKSSKGKFITTGLKTASSNKITLPQGVRVKKLAVPKATTKKIAVSKIKSNYLNRRLA